MNGGVPAGGVVHPLSHVPVGTPLVAGGIAGTAGGVGEALGDPGERGATADDADGDARGGSCPSHAASDPASTHTSSDLKDLRKRDAPERLGTPEDTDSAVP